MALAFGYDSWVGFATESTWGTRVAPSKFIRILEESMKLDQSRIAKPSLGSASQNRSVRSKRSVSGSISTQVGYNGIETLLKHTFGSVNTVLLEASTSWTHTFSLTNALPTGLTLHVNRDAADLGTAYEYEGCQVEKLTLKQDVEDFLIATFDFQGEDEATQAVATPTFPTFAGADWELMSAQINATTLKPRSVEITLENNLATDRFQLGSRLRRGLGRGSQRKLSGKIEVELDSTTEYAQFNLLTNANPLNIQWQGPTLGANNYLLQMQMANVAFTVERNVSDPGPIIATINWEAYGLTDAGNNEASILTLVNAVSSAA